MRLFIALVASISIFNAALAQEPKTYKVELNARELGLIGQALGARPFNEVANVIRRIDEQIAEQDKPKEAKPVEKSENPAKSEENPK